MAFGLSPAPDEAGAAGLLQLSDGSLVREDRFEDRYSRGDIKPQERSGDPRTETERDRGRLSYSSALRRLAGVTQVVSPDLTAARMHSRESHTHKVALLARELADLVVRRARSNRNVADLVAEVGGIDIAACEAAGLAHDLGHAPFGHAGETQLHKLLRKKTPDGFEGNPQSFRIVTRLDGRTFKRESMQLTNVTLCAILKYPWNREDANATAAAEEPSSANDPDSTSNAETPAAQSQAPVGPGRKPDKYGAYLEDREMYELVRNRVVGGLESRRQSLEASIMDLADDIAYAIHDLEDFCAAGMIDLHDVLSKIDEATAAVASIPETERFRLSGSNDPFTLATRKLRVTYHGLFDDGEYRAALDRVKLLVERILDLSSGDTMPVVLRDVLSGKIGDYFKTLEIDDALPYPGAGFVRLNSPSWHDIQALKVITRHWLIKSPRMGVIQRAQTGAIRKLFKSLAAWLGDADTEVATLPEALRDALAIAGVDLNAEELGPLDARHYRAIGDYISGLSDSEALLRSNWFAGREIPGMTMVAEAY